MAIRNIVLVHGAFADGSGWQGVYDHLTADGYRVAVVQHPTLSLAGDVAALAYIAAYAPDKGESLSTLIAEAPADAPAPPILPPQDGLLFLDRKVTGITRRG